MPVGAGFIGVAASGDWIEAVKIAGALGSVADAPEKSGNGHGLGFRFPVGEIGGGGVTGHGWRWGWVRSGASPAEQTIEHPWRG